MSFPARSTRFSNIGATGATVSASKFHLCDIIALSSGAAYFQFFEANIADVTLGTTVPVFEVFTNTDTVPVNFSVPAIFSKMCVFATTVAGGSTGLTASTPHVVQIFIN